MLDCRTLGFRLLPLFSDTQFVVCNSMVKHDHAAGEYNARRAECELATRILAEQMPETRALRDVSLADLERYAKLLPEVVYCRSRHVVSENARVLAARDALERGDPESFGRMMRESHRSLKEDYEVSSAELDLLVEIASEIAGVYGSRLTGGGFGGCTISLVRSDAVQEFQSAVASGYQRATGRQADIYVVRASDSVREVLESAGSEATLAT